MSKGRDTHRESRAREGQGEGERERRRRTHQHGPGKGRDQDVATHSGEGKRSSPPVQHEPPRSGCVAAGAMWPGVGVKPHHQLNNHWWLLVSGEHVLREGGARISKGGGQTRRRRQAGAGTPVDKVVAGEAARVHQTKQRPPPERIGQGHTHTGNTTEKRRGGAGQEGENVDRNSPCPPPTSGPTLGQWKREERGGRQREGGGGDRRKLVL